MSQPDFKRPGSREGPGPLSGLESAVLTAMLKGEGEDLATLRAQLAKATVVSRTHSGVGFVSRIQVPDAIPVLAESTSVPLRPVLAAHPHLTERAEFLLQVRGGRLAVLEAYCFEGGWPADEAEFRVVG
jgi:hypothetical protein